MATDFVERGVEYPDFEDVVQRKVARDVCIPSEFLELGKYLGDVRSLTDGHLFRFKIHKFDLICRE